MRSQTIFPYRYALARSHVKNESYRKKVLVIIHNTIKKNRVAFSIQLHHEKATTTERLYKHNGGRGVSLSSGVGIRNPLPLLTSVAGKTEVAEIRCEVRRLWQQQEQMVLVPTPPSLTPTPPFHPPPPPPVHSPISHNGSLRYTDIRFVSPASWEVCA